MRPSPLYAACIRRAVDLQGGYDALSERLGVPQRILRRWARGEGVAAESVFLRIVDILDEDAVLRSPASTREIPAGPRRGSP